MAGPWFRAQGFQSLVEGVYMLQVLRLSHYSFRCLYGFGFKAFKLQFTVRCLLFRV